jgi:hypothetical protein
MKPVIKRAIFLECVLVLAAVAFLLLQKGQEGRSAERVRFIREALSALPEEVGDWKAGDPEDIEAQQPHDVADSIRILVRIYRNSLTGARALLQASHWYAPAYCYELHGWAVLKDTVLHGNELPGYPELSGRVRELVVARKDEASTVLLYEIAVRRIPTIENTGTTLGVPSRRPATVLAGLWDKLAAKVAWKRNVIVKIASAQQAASEEDRASLLSLACEIFRSAGELLHDR